MKSEATPNNYSPAAERLWRTETKPKKEKKPFSYKANKQHPKKAITKHRKQIPIYLSTAFPTKPLMFYTTGKFLANHLVRADTTSKKDEIHQKSTQNTHITLHYNQKAKWLQQIGSVNRA